MKTIALTNLFVALAIGLATDTCAQALFKADSTWKRNVKITVDPNTLEITVTGAEPGKEGMDTNNPRSIKLSKGAKITVTVATSPPAPSAAPPARPAGARSAATSAGQQEGAAAIQLEVARAGQTQRTGYGTISTAPGNETAIVPSEGDGVLVLTRASAQAAGDKTAKSNSVELIVARSSDFIGTLDGGATFTANHRATFSLSQAISGGTIVPGQFVIVKNKNDRTFENFTATGKLYYMFGEEQGQPIATVQKALSIGLHQPGETRCGLFVGIPTGTAAGSAYQVGFSWFTDRDAKFAFSYGFNFSQEDVLLGGLKEGDIVGLSSLDNVKRMRWTTGFFFSITFRAGGVGGQAK